MKTLLALVCGAALFVLTGCADEPPQSTTTTTTETHVEQPAPVVPNS